MIGALLFLGPEFPSYKIGQPDQRFLIHPLTV